MATNRISPAGHRRGGPGRGPASIRTGIVQPRSPEDTKARPGVRVLPRGQVTPAKFSLINRAKPRWRDHGGEPVFVAQCLHGGIALHSSPMVLQSKIVDGLDYPLRRHDELVTPPSNTGQVNRIAFSRLIAGLSGRDRPVRRS